MSLQPLLDASPAIQIHAFAAIAAFLLGAAVLFRHKGDRLHRVGGRIWVALMLVVALSSFLIHTIRVWGIWSPIHLLSIATILSLAYAIHRIRVRNVIAHAAAMKTTYVGALVVAGGFTLAPGRIMNRVVFGDPAEAAHSAAPAVVAGHQGPSVIGVITNTPLWVWPLLVYVLYVGWNGTRDRIVALPRLMIMPAIVAGLALYNLVSAGPSATGLLGFAGGAGAGTLAGLAVARRRPAERRGGMVALKGDWMPLLLVIGIFAVRYASGVALGIEPALAGDATFQMVNLSFSGLFSAMMVALTAGVLIRATFRPAGVAAAARLAQPSGGK